MPVRPHVKGKIVPHKELEAIKKAQGNPLPPAMTAQLETHFGVSMDLSHVRLHTGPNAARLTEIMSAEIVAVGNHIFLNPDLQGTARAAEILAEEVLHGPQWDGPRR